MIIRKCDCGSGRDSIAEFDGYGIFLCYTCGACRNAKMQRYRRDIMERYETDEQIEPDE
jgi:hypothetical protein